MRSLVKTAFLLCIVFLTCNGLWGCSGEISGPPIGAPVQQDDLNRQPRRCNYTGRVILPDSGLDPSQYKVIVPAGAYDINPEGMFEIPMNMGTTGLITVVDSSGAPVLFKIFPKHELLLEQEPVIDLESTALTIAYMNPILASFNDPLHAAILLDLLKETDAIDDMKTEVSVSFLERRACVNNPRLAQLAAIAFDELLSQAGVDLEDIVSLWRTAQGDEESESFYDRDGIDKDAISFTGFEFSSQDNSVSLDFSNTGYKWWMATIDPASVSSPFSPQYSNGPPSEYFAALIPPAVFDLPSISGIIEQIIANALGGIIGNLTDQKSDFIAQLLDIQIFEIGPSEGEINFNLPGDSDYYQMSLYSLATESTLGDTSPLSPDRCLIPAVFQLFYQMVCPIVSIIFDGVSFANFNEVADFINTPQFAALMAELEPKFALLVSHLSNGDPAALDDCFGIISHILVKPIGMWFLREVLFKGAIQNVTLFDILGAFIAFDKAMAIGENLATFLLSAINTFNIPNFDSYIISPGVECSPDTNNAYTEAVVVDFGESADDQIVCYPDDKVDWFEFTSAGDLTGTIDLILTNSTGNADMTLYNESQAPNQSSNLGWDQAYPGAPASIPLDGLGVGTYYVRIRHLGNDYELREYRFENNGFSNDECQPDSNNAYTEAVVVDFGESADNQIVCYPDDKVDWFEFTSTGDLTGTIDLILTNSTGNADMTLYNESQAPNQSSNLGWDQAYPGAPASIPLDSLGVGTYYVRIRHLGNDYELREYRFENNGDDESESLGPTWVTEDITEYTVWTKQYSPYVLDGIDITITDTGHLVIEPGVVIKLWNKALRVEGILDAVGTEDNPIIFTSIRDDNADGVDVGDDGPTQPGPDQWELILFDDSSVDNQCIMQFCEIRFGGQHWGGIHANILCLDASPTIDNCLIQYSYGNGVRLISSSAKITNCTIINNSLYNNHYDAIGCSEGSAPIISGCTISLNNGSVIGHDLTSYPVWGPGNIHENNGFEGRRIFGDVAVPQRILTVEEQEVLPYYLAFEDLIVGPASRLTIEPGVVIKMWDKAIWVEGILDAVGTEDNPIIFTSIRDDDADGFDLENNGSGGTGPDQWELILFDDSSVDNQCIMQYCEISFGGQYWGGIHANILCRDASPTIDNCLIQYSYSDGIRIDQGSPVITNCDIGYNQNGIYCNIGGDPSIELNDIYWNSSCGIWVSNDANPVIGINTFWDNEEDVCYE